MGGTVGGGTLDQQGGSIEGRAGTIAQTELSEQEKLNQGIEALTIDLMRYHLPTAELQDFEAGQHIDWRMQGTELTSYDHYDRKSRMIKQTGRGSPGMFVRTGLDFSAIQFGFFMRATTAYNAQGRLTDASLSSFGDNVSTLEDLRESRELLIENGMLPPEPRTTAGEPLAPRPNGHADPLHPPRDMDDLDS